MTSNLQTDGDPPRPLGGRPMVGVVTEFDEDRGLGVVDSGPGWRIPFHCTAITDGTRKIAVGTVAAFVVSAGRLGRLEARSVRALPGVVPPGSTLPSTRPGMAAPSPPDELEVADAVEEAEGLRPIRDGVGQPASGADSLPGPPPEAPSEPRSASPLESPSELPPEPPSAFSSEPPSEPPSEAAHRVEPVPVPEVVESGEPTPPAGSPAGREESPASPEPPGGPVEWEGPRPDFWVPFDRSPAGPPPTWRTPATRRPSEEG